MPKKKKKQNADFQKVKIKAGKRKPKSLNEEIPSFTTKKIKINALPETSQNSKEMVKILLNGNLNSSTKISFLDKLNRVLQVELKDGSNQAGEQIQALCKYLRDPDKKCRSKAVECLKCCLNIIASNGDQALNPVMHVLFTHLNTGFTVFDSSIRDDCKQFFEYLLRKSNDTLNDHLMGIFVTKIEKCTTNKIMDYQTYNLLNIFIKNRQRYFRDDLPSSDDAPNEEEQKEDPFVIDFQPGEFQYIPLHYSCKLAEKYQDLQEFSLTSQLKPTMNLKDRFVQLTTEMITKDMKVLKARNSKTSVPIEEGKKLNFAISIAKVLQTLPVPKR